MNTSFKRPICWIKGHKWLYYGIWRQEGKRKFCWRCLKMD